MWIMRNVSRSALYIYPHYGSIMEETACGLPVACWCWKWTVWACGRWPGVGSGRTRTTHQLWGASWSPVSFSLRSRAQKHCLLSDHCGDEIRWGHGNVIWFILTHTKKVFFKVLLVLRSCRWITTRNKQYLLLTACYMHKQAECLFFLSCGFYLHSQTERVKKAAGRKDMKGWFKSSQMVGTNQAVSLGYITNTEHAFKGTSLHIGLWKLLSSTLYNWKLT